MCGQSVVQAQQIHITHIDLLLTGLVLKKPLHTVGSEILTACHKVLQALGMKSHSKAALKFFYVHTAFTVWMIFFLTCTDGVNC
jgi:hypothetical protein